ncbi:TPA: hypothetical protein JAN72_04205 [Legionella pneumophila]|nr:hypothetical protein [Legionella pneumophila]
MLVVQGMNSLLDIKQDLLVVPDGETIASNQAIKQSSNQAIKQSTLDFPLFSLFSIIFYCISFLYSGFRFISLRGFYPMLHVRAFTPMLCQSTAADCILFSLNDSFLLCKEHL